MNMKKMMHMVLVTMMLFVCGGAYAQEKKTTEVFNFAKMLELQNDPWTLDQKLDGEEIVRRKSGIIMAFGKGAGKTDPEITTCDTPKGDEVKAVCLYPGNSLFVTSETKNIVKVEIQFVAKSKAATGKNYEISEGEYNGNYPYVWTGKTQNWTLKNLNNKGGMQITRMVAHYEDAD